MAVTTSNTDEAEIPPYTAFSVPQQRLIIVLVTLAALSSPITAILYLPLVPSLATHYDVSIQAINLTITIYIIFQAIAPMLLSTHSDTFGRRPIYIISFAIYTVASLGLALNGRSYAVLATLRAVQSLGASSILSICYGTVADLRPSSNRGKLLGTVLACSNLGTAVGPVIGGAIANAPGGLSWAFWVMFIFASVMLLAILVLMSETARNVVANGSLRDKRWNRPLIDFPRTVGSIMRRTGTVAQKAEPSRHLAFKSPIRPILLMFHPDTALNLWVVGSFYAIWYAVQTSIPLVFEAPPYEFSNLQVGLSYLPGAAGVITCMYATGWAMDYNYRIVSERHGQHHTSDNPGNDHEKQDAAQYNKANSSSDSNKMFPIELARSRHCVLLSLVAMTGTLAYGWTVQSHTHPSGPLILQFVVGFLCTWILNMFNALLVDIFPEAPSTAATAGNLVRCGFSAAAVAAMEPLSQTTNRGVAFTVLGVLGAGGASVAIWALRRWGLRWRVRRHMQ